MLFTQVSALTLAGVALASPVAPNSHLRQVRIPLATRNYGNGSETMRAEAVKEGFMHAWNGYYKYAFPSDELLPVSNGAGNSRNGWGASAVDAFSTAIVMEIQEIVDEIVDHIQTIDFTKTATEVSLFETTIRYLGGMLSGYDLISSNDTTITADPDKLANVLTQSKNLAEALKFAFDTPTGIPYNGLNFTTKMPNGSPQNGLATVGTLVMEWQRLSDLTGNAEYGQLAAKGESYLLDPKPAFAEPFPGLVGSNINITNGEFLDANGGWNGGDDSFYEYLIKMYVYDRDTFSQYKDRWVLAADSSMKYLASHPSSRSDLTYLAAYENTTLDLESSHLACFDGGNFLLGGAVLGEQKYIDFGLQLTEACHNTYISTATQIGPEQFRWDGENAGNQTDFFNEHGFYITNTDYDLRPEVIESYYYAYRLTGDSKYQDWAWDAFVAINATTRTDSGFSEVSNINVAGGGTKEDLQESFLFAEVMKYSYLIHAPDAPYQVAKDDSNTYVYNTECHPFKVKTKGTSK